MKATFGILSLLLVIGIGTSFFIDQYATVDIGNGNTASPAAIVNTLSTTEYHNDAYGFRFHHPIDTQVDVDTPDASAAQPCSIRIKIVGPTSFSDKSVLLCGYRKEWPGFYSSDVAFPTGSSTLEETCHAVATQGGTTCEPYTNGLISGYTYVAPAPNGGWGDMYRRHYIFIDTLDPAVRAYELTANSTTSIDAEAPGDLQLVDGPGIELLTSVVKSLEFYPPTE